MRKQRWITALIASATLLFSLISTPSAPALTFKSAPAKYWGYTYASTAPTQKVNLPTDSIVGTPKSEWRVTYTNFPEDAKVAVENAVDIWAAHFTSKIAINVEATWQSDLDISVLGSARPGFYFNSFPGAPDDDLWYPSTLANTLAGKDLDSKQPEIYLRINSKALWYLGIDGKTPQNRYDLSTVVLHEIGHGLGFLSNAEYDRFFGTGYMFQPTPFDAYVQLPDGRTFVDFCSRSADLGKAMINPLVWNGELGVSANGGVKPKLYTPSAYIEGSSVTHLDETLFGKSVTDALMTPNIEPGEAYGTPGSVAVAMIEDMLKKPPLGVASDVPAKPINARAIVGDKYALVTFDSPNCRRIDRITGFTVTTSPGGAVKKFDSSPAKITGLKNGTSYTFTVTAENAKGSSEAVTTNSIKPESGGKISIIDPRAKVSNFTSLTWRNQQIIVYGDYQNGLLKLATYKSKKWVIQTIKQGVKVGPISLCKSGSGSKEILHIVYSDLESKDVFHGYQSNNKWKFEVVDGNGETVQDYRDPIRSRTASDVSVSNACAVTPDGLQIFYRDETQGILLAAIDTSNGWVYEIVDGDRKSDGRTTGDVAFHLSAASIGKTVYLFYDSVLTISANQTPTEGEVRLASRNSIYPEDWKFVTVDGPDAGVAVAGYGTSLSVVNKDLALSWLSASGESLPNVNQLKFTTFDNLDFPGVITVGNYGRPQLPIALDSKGLVFGCQDRLCKSSQQVNVRLANGASTISSSGAIITLDKIRYFIASIKGTLSLTKL